MKRVDVAYVFLQNEESQILLVKNKGRKSSYYTLPGGAVEKGETLEQAAIREAKEETGLDVKVQGIIGVNEAFFSDRGHHAVFFIFQAVISGGSLTITRPEEIEEVVWMDYKEASPYIEISKLVKLPVSYQFQGMR